MEGGMGQAGFWAFWWFWNGLQAESVPTGARSPSEPLSSCSDSNNLKLNNVACHANMSLRPIFSSMTSLQTAEVHPASCLPQLYLQRCFWKKIETLDLRRG